LLHRTDIEAIAGLIADRVLLSIPTSGRWLSIDEAMAYAKVKSRSTIMVWINKGHIYAHKRTGSWIVDRESIDKWYQSSK